MDETSKTELKPFHEPIVDLICDIGKEKEVNSLSVFFDERRHRLRAFGIVLLATKIPNGHDKIIEVWQAQSLLLGLNDVLNVVASVTAQKWATAEAARKKTQSA